MVFNAPLTDLPTVSKREKRKSRKSYNFELTDNYNPGDLSSNTNSNSSNNNPNSNDNVSTLDVAKDERRTRWASPVPASLTKEFNAPMTNQERDSNPKKVIKSREFKEKELKETKERKDSKKKRKEKQKT